jgi:hypothetical protein
LLACALACVLSSCHLTFGGRGTQTCFADRTLDRTVVRVGEIAPRGD